MDSPKTIAAARSDFRVEKTVPATKCEVLGVLPKVQSSTRMSVSSDMSVSSGDKLAENVHVSIRVAHMQRREHLEFPIHAVFDPTRALIDRLAAGARRAVGPVQSSSQEARAFGHTFWFDILSGELLVRSESTAQLLGPSEGPTPSGRNSALVVLGTCRQARRNVGGHQPLSPWGHTVE